MNTDSQLNSLGVLDLMRLLHELHLRGFQRLRWVSYMSPNGFYLRCHIADKSQVYANRFLTDDSYDLIWRASIGQLSAGIEDITPFVDVFIRENPMLIRIAEGDDTDYVNWFARLLSAVKEETIPQYEVEYFGSSWQLPFGHIKVGDDLIPVPSSRFRLISWNIDGIKAHFEALQRLILEYKPDAICLQKVKDIHMSSEFEIKGYHREGSQIKYGGVVTYVRNCIPCKFESTEGQELKGHFLKTEILHPSFTLYNVYVPFSNPAVAGAIDHRKAFDLQLRKIAGSTPDRQIICGDMNIVASEIDCWNRKYQRKQANFHDWERENFLLLLHKAHLIDTFRHFNPFSQEFTYFFRNDPNVRAANEGYRIDYILASASFEPHILRAAIIKDYTVSSNNPILLDFRF